MPKKGYIQTKEHKEKLRQAHLGKKTNEETRKKMSLAHKGKYTEENSSNWKGDAVGYQGIHSWIQKKLGKPNMCEECGTTEAKKFEWANISGQYKRDVTDYKRLCTKCHMIMDGTINNLHWRGGMQSGL